MRYTTPPKEYNDVWANDLIKTLTKKDEHSVLAALRGYEISNYTISRTLDASTADATAVANFLCTMIYDIKRVQGGA